MKRSAATETQHVLSKIAHFPLGHMIAASAACVCVAIFAFSSPPSANTPNMVGLPSIETLAAPANTEDESWSDDDTLSAHTATPGTHYETLSTIANDQLELDIPLKLEPARPQEIKRRIEAANKASNLTTINATVKNGDSLARIFQRNKLSPQSLHMVMQSGKEVDRLKAIHPGQQLTLTVDDNKELQRIDYQISKLEKLIIALRTDSLSEDGKAKQYEAYVDTKSIDTKVKFAAGTIKDSLFSAAKESGLTDNTTMQLANIFGWDLDFVLDIRLGDSFEILYEDKYIDGSQFSNGDILVASFVNRGKKYTAFRYEDSNGVMGYYDGSGNSLRKAFIRTPVDFARISSKFNLRRLHPIFKTTRPHKGVDYAAPSGTPIKAAGDGKVITARTKGGYGKTVVIRHGTKYSTLYAHLSKWANGVREGSRVKQGQIIGYVGSTGWATGPHLHYEFRVNGAHRNPLTVELPQGAGLPKKELERFELASSNLQRQLALRAEQNRTLAQND